MQKKSKKTDSLWHRFIEWDKAWDNRHSRATYWLGWISIFVVSLSLSSVFIWLSIPFGLITVLSADALKTLIEAEATILGFFGLIVVYALTAYDNRIDKLEERIEDWQQNDKPVDLVLLKGIMFSDVYRDRQDKIKKRKQIVTSMMLVSLGSLVISFFLFITAYGILTSSGTTTQIAREMTSFPLSLAASMLLFVGILSIFMMLFRMGKEPKK
jgi:hypothetical protein